MTFPHVYKQLTFLELFAPKIETSNLEVDVDARYFHSDKHQFMFSTREKNICQPYLYLPQPVFFWNCYLLHFPALDTGKV